MAVGGFNNDDTRGTVVEEKGVPMPDLLVPFVTGMLPVANHDVVSGGSRGRPRARPSSIPAKGRGPRSTASGRGPRSTTSGRWKGKERQENKIAFPKNPAPLGGAPSFLNAANERGE